MPNKNDFPDWDGNNPIESLKALNAWAIKKAEEQIDSVLSVQLLP